MIEPPPCTTISGMTCFMVRKALFRLTAEHPVPRLLGEFDHAADLGDADIVVEHVDAAEVRDARLHHRLDVVVLRHVGAERQREAALVRR